MSGDVVVWVGCPADVIVGDLLDRSLEGVHHPRPMSELAGTHTDFDAQRSGVSMAPATSADVPRPMDSYVSGTVEMIDVGLARLADRLEHLEHRLSDILEPAQPTLAADAVRTGNPGAPLVNALNGRAAELNNLVDRLERLTARLAL